LSQALHEVYATYMGCAVRLIKGFVQPIEGTSSSFVISNRRAPLRRKKSSYCSEMTRCGLSESPATGFVLTIFVYGRLGIPHSTCGLNVWQWSCRQKSVLGATPPWALQFRQFSLVWGIYQVQIKTCKKQPISPIVSGTHNNGRVDIAWKALWQIWVQLALLCIASLRARPQFLSQVDGRNLNLGNNIVLLGSSWKSQSQEHRKPI
jgi:hypothetical protein